MQLLCDFRGLFPALTAGDRSVRAEMDQLTPGTRLSLSLAIGQGRVRCLSTDSTLTGHAGGHRTTLGVGRRCQAKRWER
jgi:hypothetical protein